MHGESAFGGEAMYDLANKGVWQDVSVTDTAVSGTTARILLYELSSFTTGYILATDLQLIAGKHVVPFENSVGSANRVHIPYDVLDCKQDFSIYGWWYPKAYADGVYRPCLTRNIPSGNSTYNRILIMGNGTSSTQLQVWASSDDAAESIVRVSTNVTVKVDEWNFFCLRRIGGSLYITLANSMGIQTNSSAIAYRLDEDEVGQVWQIGEYAGSMSDAYHKDYVFHQEALTTTEVEEIVKTKLRAKSTGLLIQNSVETGIILN